MPNIEQATQLLAKYQCRPPVNVKQLAKEFGVRVEKKWNFDENVSGMMKKGSNSKGSYEYTIVVNANQSIEQQRFTIAHQIAHLILHENKIGDEMEDTLLYHGTLGNLEERLANKLAVEILMPEVYVFDMIEKGTKSISDLAEAFKVSAGAMRMRLGIPFEADKIY